MSDQLRPLFETMRNDAWVAVKPPGADATGKTVRKRRQRRIVALTLLLVIAIAVPAWAFEHPQGMVQPTEPDPTISQSVDPQPSASPTPTGVTPQQPGRSTGSTPGCTRYGMAMYGDTAQYSVSFTGGGLYARKNYKLCRGETVRVWWVQYEWQADGSQKLLGSGSGIVSYDKPKVSLAWPDYYFNECLSYMAVGTGAFSFPKTIARGVRPDPLIPAWRPGKGGSTLAGMRSDAKPSNCTP